MNVKVEDIRSIAAGTAKNFQCESPEKLNSAKTLVGYCNKIKKPRDVWKYISKSNWKDLTITITAISTDGVKPMSNEDNSND